MGADPDTARTPSGSATAMRPLPCSLPAWPGCSAPLCRADRRSVPHSSCARTSSATMPRSLPSESRSLRWPSTSGGTVLRCMACSEGLPAIPNGARLPQQVRNQTVQLTTPCLPACPRGTHDFHLVPKRATQQGLRAAGSSEYTAPNTTSRKRLRMNGCGSTRRCRSCNDSNQHCTLVSHRSGSPTTTPRARSPHQTNGGVTSRDSHGQIGAQLLVTPCQCMEHSVPVHDAREAITSAQHYRWQPTIQRTAQTPTHTDICSCCHGDHGYTCRNTSPRAQVYVKLVRA